jgi:hypothetical protein
MKNKSISPQPTSHKAMVGQGEDGGHGEDIKIGILYQLYWSLERLKPPPLGG